MKTKHLIIILTFMVLNLSCNDLNKLSNYNKSFEYTIEGQVRNGEGLVFTLNIPENDKIIKAKVENGRFLIEGVENRIKLSQCGIEGSKIFGHVLVEPGLSIFAFDVLGDSPNYYFSKPVAVEGKNNKVFFDFAGEFEEAFQGRGWVFSDSVRMDSMHRNIYPELRKDIFGIYNKYFPIFNSDLKLISLNFITDGLDSFGPFDKRYLRENEIKNIMHYFNSIDTSLSEEFEYQQVKMSLKNISEFSVGLSFIDYDLKHLDGSQIKLSELINHNEYSILYFWHFRCRPCRKFNQDMHSYYRELKKHSINLISINLDEYNSDWKKASIQDNIFWNNLYGGKSTISKAYSIRQYPTYLLIDENYNVKELDFDSSFDLINWAKMKEKK